MPCRWRPPSQLKNHTGGLIASETILFAPPPVEIGTLLSAQCGVSSSGSAVAGEIPRKVIGLFILLGVVVGGFLGAGVSHLSWFGSVLGALLGALLIGGPIYRRELKRNDCTYVGTLGIARYPFSRRNRSNPTPEIFLFANAVDLQTAYLGRNSGTNFNYQWKDAQGKTLHKMEGGYYGNDRKIDPEADLHFARAAEEAWTQFILPRVKDELQRTGSYRLLTRRGLSSKQYAVIGPGYLDVITDGKTFHNLAGDLEDIVLHQGWIIIRRKDAQNRAMNSLDGSHGICYLSYGSVSNVKLFLTLLTQVVGVTIRS